MPQNEDAPAAAPAAMPGGGSFLAAGLSLVALLVLLMWAMHKLDGAEKLANIRGTAYNVVVIGLAATIFIPVAKYLTARFPVPGITPWVQSA